MNPLFFDPTIYTIVNQNQKEMHPLAFLWKEPWTALSEKADLSHLQDSCAIRNRLLTHAIAHTLIDEQGKIVSAVLEQLLKEGKKHQFFLLPGWEIDASPREHIMSVLQQLKQKPRLQKTIERFSKPLRNPIAEQVIRDTLGLNEKHNITDVDVRRAVLIAWMTYLRQNVGSCFATAPGILIQQEQPEQFLADLEEMIATSKIKRIVGGQEFAFPMSIRAGVGNLKRPVLVGEGGGPSASQIASNPSLLQAFSAMGIFPSDWQQQQVVKHVADWIDSQAQRADFFTITAEEILEGIFYRQKEFTKADLERFQKQQALPVSPLEIAVIPKGGIQGAKRFEEAMQLLTKAKRIFQNDTECALVKTWEYTLASFAETKAKFTRWNLYTSLGFPVEEPGGIGEVLQQSLQEKLDEANRQVHDMQRDYEQAYAQVKFLESRLRHASEEETRWLRSEYQMRMHEFQTIEEMRDQQHHKARLFAELYQYLVERYYDLFPVYFQEVYDPDLHDVQLGPFDDSPAGFRLLFKHGRALASQWTPIYSKEEFVHSLVTFFSLTERDVVTDAHVQSLEQEISSIITTIIHHVQTDRFLETAFYRMAASHQMRIPKNPLAHIDAIAIKPWAYTSGGTMDNLVSAYYQREERPTESQRWVENDTELLVFFIDVLKEMPPAETRMFHDHPEKSLLMHSPTHAFLLKPGWQPFFELWNHEAYTYTWLRDQYILPVQRWLDDCVLSQSHMDRFLEQWKQRLPHSLQNYFLRTARSLYRSMNSVEFRSHVLLQIERDRNLRGYAQNILSADVLDASLYEALPLLPYTRVHSLFKEIIDQLSITSREKGQVMQAWERSYSQLSLPDSLTPLEWQGILQQLLILGLGRGCFERNLALEIQEMGRSLRVAFPKPILVADTNWMKDVFGFTVNPGTGLYEFWRFDRTTKTGCPMFLWRQWLNGTRQDPKWGIYTQPAEYKTSL